MSLALTSSPRSDTVTPMRKVTTRISIKELHAKTGEQVRIAGRSRNPIAVTDRGKLVALLVAPHLYRPNIRQRTILPEYAALLTKEKSNDVLDDLDAVRGDR
jgi:hypothetical protein